MVSGMLSKQSYKVCEWTGETILGCGASRSPTQDLLSPDYWSDKLGNCPVKPLNSIGGVILKIDKRDCVGEQEAAGLILPLRCRRHHNCELHCSVDQFPIDKNQASAAPTVSFASSIFGAR